MNYTLIIGLISLISAAVTLFLTNAKENASKIAARKQREEDSVRIEKLDLTIKKLNAEAAVSAIAHKEELLHKSESIEKEQEILIKKQADAIIMQEQAMKMQLVLQEKTEQMALFSERLKNEITGGTSFCTLNVHIGPDPTNPNRHIEYFYLNNQGDFPLQDISIIIEKPQIKWDKRKTLPIELYQSVNEDPTLNYRFRVQYLPEKRKENNVIGGLLTDVNQYPLHMSIIPEDQLKSGRLTYLAVIHLRKGSYQMLVKLYNYKGVWLQASKIISQTDSIYHYEQVHPNFTFDPDDHRRWHMIITH
ncbi:MAG: hypothetical protein EOP48_19330 [Sphingobacteriales bacterium]|nr:MAG: hypothetical protein EOP48_19330 [Sphingobacteriales bacterium]